MDEIKQIEFRFSTFHINGFWLFNFILIISYQNFQQNSRAGYRDKLWIVSALLLRSADADQSEASEASLKNVSVLIGLDWMLCDWVTSATT